MSISSGRVAAYVALGLLISLVITYFMAVNIGGYDVSGEIYIDEKGVPKIILNGTVERGLEEIPLPAEPTPASVVVYINDEVRTPVLINNTVLITADPGSSFRIVYIPKLDTQGEGISFKYYSDYETSLSLSNNIVLLSLPETILSSGYVGGVYTIKFKGFYEIRYVVSEAVAEPPPIEPQPEFPWFIIPLAILGVAGAGAGLYLFLRRRRAAGEVDLEEAGLLDETDRLILETLEEEGGEMYQSELVRRLGIPKTTLWRHIRRLEVLGYVEVVKEYKRNRVRLLKKP